MTWNDPFNNAYKKLFFNKAGTQLLGGILVGDASDYTTLLVGRESAVRQHSPLGRRSVLLIVSIVFRVPSTG